MQKERDMAIVPAEATLPSVGRTRFGILLRLVGRAARHRQRRVLAELDDALLRDIGVTRAEARAECAKPFWRR